MMQLQNPLSLNSVKDRLAWRHRWLPALSVALFYLVLAAAWLRWCIFRPIMNTDSGST